jgi:hypothetical protein
MLAVLVHNGGGDGPGSQRGLEYAEGARHTDANVVFQTLPDALAWLWQGYGVK